MPPDVPADRTDLSIQQAADELGLHYMTMYRYVRTGRVTAAKHDGRWLVPRRALDEIRQATRGNPEATRERLRRQLEDRLRAADEPGAWAVVEQALASGAEPADIHLLYLIPCLGSIGDQWAAGEVSVLQEHQASTVAGRLAARLGPRFVKRPTVGTIILGAPSGDTHGLATAILADLLRDHHFDVVDLGADTPPASFVELAGSVADLVAVGISVHLAANEDMLATTISDLKAATSTCRVIVGGPAIAEANAVAAGADVFCETAEELLDAAQALV